MPEHYMDSRSGALVQFQHFRHIVLKWKWTALITFILIFGGGTLYCFLVPPTYMSSGRIWIEDEPNILPFEEIKSIGAGSFLQSQARLLESRALAAGVIEKLKLYENPAFIGKLGRGKRPPDPADLGFRESLITSFIKNITIAPITGTQMVDVRFSLGDSQQASATLDALFDGFIEMVIRKRYMASEKATEFLDRQIASLRADIEEREKKLNAYGSQKDILPLTSAETPTVTKLTQLNKSLTEATIDRIDKYNRYAQINAAPLGEIPNAPADGLIQSLRQQYSTLSREYSKRLATLRPEYPEMQRLKSEVDAAKEALQAETQNLARKAYQDFTAAQQKEQSIQQLLNENKNEAFRDNSNAVQYNSLRIELESRKTLLQTLSKRKSETDVSTQLKGLEAINVWVVDRADHPVHPASPNKRKIVLISLIIGLAGGVGLALGLESQTQTINTSKDVKNATGLLTIGIVPAFESSKNVPEFTRLVNVIRGNGMPAQAKENKARSNDIPESPIPIFFRPDPSGEEKAKSPKLAIELIAALEPYSIQAESYRSIRTTLLVSAPPNRIHVVLFTSALAREGKSSTVSNLAAVLSKVGKKVVVVDTDLRKPKQGKIFNAQEGPTLAEYLNNPNLEIAEIVKTTSFPNLNLITCGPPQKNVLEVLTSSRMEELIKSLREQFDYVLLDSPPILAVSDALVIGQMVDATILVARGGITPVAALKQAKQKLDAHKIVSLGVILNGVDLIEQDVYYAHQYYHYADR
jgi:polysaccharide biosynthesis transport protein